ncbi:PLP-dependent aminotransferase family protein [Methylobacterium gossipiicola]|uniref:8-amino-7-oxononanoate synthase n=1 Tax=Methylobacterium gossipiicola TaxID=582675 RepID=A0A1I2XN70_9HYPH|nr:PLP-dependent aminotransferase family protein [Methylobacterium gossipiicola]SFH14944.1 GntR family transcriptional regulator / MocR family aminotransferase [Methylobacterium gossipiicola]
MSLFPIRTWRKLAQRALSETDNSFFYDPDPAGHLELRNQISHYLGYARGINCDPDDIIITTGTRHRLDLCLRSLTRPGDTVWMEAPGYAGAEALIGVHRLASVPISVDDHGLRVDAAEEMAPNAKLCIVTPSHQSPLGVRLSFERRQKLLAWAAWANAYIIEDDYDGEFSFDTARFPAFKAMDIDDRVIHAGSFNKVLFPTLRTGYLVPKSMRSKVQRL